MHRNVRFAFAVPLLLSGFARSASAEPPILNTVAKFNNAIAKGSYAGVSATAPTPINVSNRKALQKTRTANFGNLQTTRVSTNISPVNGAVAAPNTPPQVVNPKILGAVYWHGPDPDYTNALLSFDVYVPQVGPPSTSGIDSVQFTVIDSADNVKSWEWNDTALVTGLNSFSFFLSQNAGAGGSTGFFKDGSFDLTQASSLQINWLGTLTSTYPPTPPTLDPLPSPSLWIGNSKLNVTPEPSAALTLALGTLTLALTRRKRPSAKTNP